MELDELIFLGACSLYQSQAKQVPPTAVKKIAVRLARKIWQEVLRQEREEL